MCTLNPARPDQLALAQCRSHIYIDGNSYIEDSIRHAGAAVVDLDKTLWASALPSGLSAQRAELIALTKALKFGKDNVVNIYIESQMHLPLAHVHRTIYSERNH